MTDATLRQLRGHDTLCRFPQYKGYTFREVVLRDVEFTEWIMDTSRNHKAFEIRQFQAWLNHHLKKTPNGLKIKRVEERTPPTFPMDTPAQMTPIRPQNAQCVDGCTWSYAGSNAYVEQKTCKVCGYREKRSKDKPLAVYSPETCPHQIRTNVDHQNRCPGSTACNVRALYRRCHSRLQGRDRKLPRR